ncbi:GNAT family N-acetyltransferase [Actinoplanes sp. GCM10030250]|uniref:GNAT family N-acetyltransferase n=1 Tax=Actinoplanes sp. GCM10030250 TaxID=3273376 RepID=UPI0036212D99
MIVQRESAGQAAEIHAVTLAAFGQAAEADLVDELRADDGWIPALSLVAIVDGAVAGHVACTRSDLGGTPSLGLGPLSVHPDHQGRGVGKALVHTALGAADALGEPLVVLLGDPAYYSRFGFRLAAEFGITPPVAEWAPHFQVRTLSAYRPELRGAFTYADPFNRM